MENKAVNNAEIKSELPPVKRLWLVSFLGVIVLASLALLGWVSGWRLLASFLSYYRPMAPSTAVCFILLGLSGFFQPDKGSSRICAVACVCGVLAVMTFGVLEACTILAPKSVGSRRIHIPSAGDPERHSVS